jgi:hypothetical protein
VRFQIAQNNDPLIHEDSPAGAAAREKLGKLIIELGNAENESLGVELGARYRNSPIICQEDNEPAWDRIRFIPSTWPGVRAPHVFLDSGEAIFDLFGPGFTLVRFTETNVDGFVAAAAERGVPLTLLDVSDANARRIYERDLVLVRPDHYVAWRGNAAPANALAIIDHVRGA